MATGRVRSIGLGRGDKDMSALCLPPEQIAGAEICPKQA
jgi:hypothetical protein